MRLLAHVHKYPPVHNAGAEWMLHSILRWLVARGHDAVVLAKIDEGYTIDGVRVLPVSPAAQQEAYAGADVVITHLDETRRAMLTAQRHGLPVVHLIHNDRQLTFHRVRTQATALVVFNSVWLENRVPWRGRHIVVRPPVFVDDYATQPGDCVTLINLSPAKGAGLFWQLAEAMPDVDFLGVHGSYAQQVIPKTLPPNVEVLPNQPDARTIYARTRVLLMPSSYESWGRVAIEAAASGIPTVAAPAPGLVESLGPAGTFCSLDSPDDWVQAIRYLLVNPSAYEQASVRALTRSTWWEPTRDLELFEREVASIVGVAVNA